MHNPVVSILILTWNRRADLGRCIDSALAQTYPNKEIVVADNHSEDDTKIFVKGKYPGIRFVALPENIGCPSGRNAGARHCNGAFIYFLDDDGWLDSEAVALAVARAEQDASIGVVCSSIRTVGNGQVLTTPVEGIAQGGYQALFFGGCSLIRADLFKNLGGYPVWDMLCLAGALAITMRLLEPPGPAFWHTWFLDLPIWVTPTFSLLAMSRTYVTVWTRARVLDVLMLLFTLQAGLLLSLGIALLIDPSDSTRLLMRAVVIAALGHAAIIGLRIFYRCVEEIVMYLRSNSDLNNEIERVVLYGAGGRCQLFLKERGFHNSSSFDGRMIAGLIDDEPALHFKWVQGHMVLGGLRDLPALLGRHRITGIVITAALTAESQATLRALVFQNGLSLSEWCFEERKLAVHSPEANWTSGLESKRSIIRN
jgi:glycosyltransferase involved in cell wall biosynthesis